MSKKVCVQKNEILIPLALLVCFITIAIFFPSRSIQAYAIPNTVQKIWGKGITDKWQERWLSAEDSRMIINPVPEGLKEGQTQSSLTAGPNIPLNVGYLGPKNNTMTKDVIQLSDTPGKNMYATKYQNSWRPDRLGYKSRYASGMNLSGTDFFKNTDTILREINKNNQGELYISGKLNGNNFKVSDRFLTYDNSVNRNGISFSIKPTNIKFYRNKADLEKDKSSSKKPYQNGFFLADFSNMKNSKLYVGFTTGSINEKDNSFLKKTSKAVRGNVEFASKKATNRVNQYYAKIPVPDTHHLSVKNPTTSAKQQLQTYYKGWSLMHDNILPSSPEIGFNYPSYATSKFIMWHTGAPKTRYAASWETFYTMQYESLIDPTKAWNGFIGQISQISSNGTLAGEGLPVNRARTALILYNNSLNSQQGLNGLKQTYQKIDKNLSWSLNNPRWVFPNSGVQNTEKDCDFLASSIIDVPYMQQIYSILSNKHVISPKNARDKISELEKAKETQLKNYSKWFFYNGHPVQKVQVTGNKIEQPEIINQLMVTKGLHIPGMEQENANKLLDYYNSLFNSNVSFGNMGVDKYEEYAYTVYGLLDHRKNMQATQLIDTSLRDIPRAHSLGEELRAGENGDSPYIGGVQVSAFAAAQMIDSMFMRNNLRMDEGKLNISNITNQQGRVRNIHSGSDTISYRLVGNKVYIIKNGKLSIHRLNDMHQLDLKIK